MVATSTAIPTVTCDGSKSGDVTSRTIPDAKASITAFSLLAPMIQINWQSSDRVETMSSASPDSASHRITASGTLTIDTSATSSAETLILDGSPQTAGGGNIDFGNTAPSTTPSRQGNEASSESGPFGSGAKVAIGVVGAVAVIMMVVCALFYFWRRRKNQREEQEMDRLYGVKGTMGSGGDFSSGDIPGWYRGQRLATPTKDPFARHHRVPSGVREIEPPPAPYYRPYRPDPDRVSNVM
jgi:hypothetical protein